MNLVGLTVSVNYSDYLQWSLPAARTVFDRLLVVTDTKDEKTKKVCEFWGTEYLQTDIFYENGAVFNKGKAIQLGLEYLNPKDWVILMDADIVLPPRFNEFIRCKKLHTDFIYGIDRLNIKSFGTWSAFMNKPFPMHVGNSVWAGFDLMYRCLSGQSYIPIGFYQQFNVKSKYFAGYPTIYEDAADSDVNFSLCWPEENRSLIPECFVYHLSSEKTDIGANWKGRVTKEFGPEKK